MFSRLKSLKIYSQDCPVKSLFRFRCVSKSWNDLQTAPKFIAAHLNQSKKNKKNLKLMATPAYTIRICTYAYGIRDPSTRKYKSLRDIYVYSNGYGFSYNEITKDYKIVTVVSDTNDRDLYSDEIIYTGRHQGVLVNGSLHWLASISGTPGTKIIAFNIVSESFNEVRKKGYPFDSLIDNELSALDGQLCITYNYSNYVELWVMKKWRDGIMNHDS
ncbi:hypothetical protein IFM89_039148 [Coptis chinensis]|uniref:F-box protein n=1 Tax=Coptis chinensis TaxID=261450 RepID=A0A835HVA5_9MAGN|nr:hypothetical protein IFM89_039148 [Coptis chinensis]